MIFMTAGDAFEYFRISGKLVVYSYSNFVIVSILLSLIGIFLLVSFPRDGFNRFMTDLLPESGLTSDD